MSRNYDKLEISHVINVNNIRINYKNVNKSKSSPLKSKCVYIDCHLIYKGREYGMMKWESKDNIQPSSSVREERRYDPVIMLRKSNNLGSAIIHISHIVQKQLLADLEKKDSEIWKIMRSVKLKTNVKNLKLSTSVQETYDDEEGESVEMKDPIVRVGMKKNKSTGNFLFGVYKMIKNKDDPNTPKSKEIKNKNLYDNAHKYFTKNTRMIGGDLKITIVVYSKGISIKPEFRKLLIHVDKASDNASNIDFKKMGINMEDMGDFKDDFESDSDDNGNNDSESDGDDKDDDKDDDDENNEANLAKILDEVSKQ